jgi:SAM-dependent methyltransferase
MAATSMETSAYHDMSAVEAEHWWFTGRRRVLHAVIARLGLPAGAEILELGSGTGGNFDLLRGFGRLTAVEMSETARALAGARAGDVELLPGMLPHDLPLDGRRFDLVCLFDVLEHVEDDEATLREVRALLKPGGAAVITVPAHRALYGPHDMSLHHKRRYQAGELRAKLAAAGLRAETFSYMNAALLPVAWTLRWLDKLLDRTQATGTSTPPAPVNAVLAAVFGAEAWVLPRMTLPFGLSLLAVVRSRD